jgi:hypothetical protein
MPEINYLAVLVAAIATMVVGMLWFGPLFGKRWAEGQGWTAEDRERMKKMNMNGLYVQQFVASIIMAFVLYFVVLNMIVNRNGEDNVLSGVYAGFWMWVGFILPVKWGDSLWNGKQLKYVSIEMGYWLVNLIVMGIILSVWQ